jgi:hypothetical protein
MIWQGLNDLYSVGQVQGAPPLLGWIFPLRFTRSLEILRAADALVCSRHNKTGARGRTPAT